MDLAPPSVSAGGSRPQKTTGTKLRKKTTRKNTAKTTGKGFDSGDLARRLADPGLRSKLPDSALTPDLLAVRKRNQYNAAPAAPGSSYSNSALDKLVEVLTGQKFGPVEQEIARAQQAIDLRGQTQIPAWFQSYRDTVAQARANQQVQAAAQVGSLQQMATQAQGDMGAPVVGGGNEAAARAQAAAQIRGAGVLNQGALAQNQGAAQDSFLGNLGLLSFDQQAAAMQALFGKQTELNDEKRQVASDKGAFKVSQRGEILGDESKQALEQALADATIGTKKADAVAKKATAQKTKVQTQKSKKDQAYFEKHGYYPSTGKPTNPETASQAAQAAKNGYTLAEWRKMSSEERRKIIQAGGRGKAGDKDEYGNTTKQQQASQDAFDKALRIAKQYKDAGAVKTESELVDFLVGTKNINIAHARAAAQALFHDGRVGPKTRDRLQRRGVRKFPKSKPKPKPVAPPKAVDGPLEILGGPLARQTR